MAVPVSASELGQAADAAPSADILLAAELRAAVALVEARRIALDAALAALASLLGTIRSADGAS